MSDDNQSSFAVPVSLLATIILATGSIAWVYRGLEPSRPQESLKSAIREDDQGFDARLWQDPLEQIEDLRAVEAQSFRARPDQYRLGSYIENHPSVLRQQDLTEAVARLQADTESACTVSDACLLTLVGVLVPDSPYALSVEKRRRIRYAVVSALTNEYLPREADRIGIVAIDTERKPGTLPKLLSFEVYEHQVRREGRYVVVLWIPSSVYGGNFDGVRQILETFSPRSPEDPDTVRTVVLGPTDSDELALFAPNRRPTGLGNWLRTVDMLDADPPSPRVGSIIAHASMYLDEGIPPAIRVDELIGCLGNADSEALIESCLDVLEIKDSDSEWPASVALAWWEANSQIKPDYEAVGTEPPASPVQYTPAYETWARAVLTALERESSQAFTPDYFHWRAQFLAPRNGPTPVSSIIAAADEYLDTGLPGNVAMEPLVTCLSGSESQSQVASCLDQLGIRDSDEAWHETVAGRWLEEHPQAAWSFADWLERATDMPASARTLIDDYLDTGLPDGVLSEQEIDACRKGAEGNPTPITAFGECLRSSGTGIEDSDPEWFLTIARQFGQALFAPDVVLEVERSIEEQHADRDKVGSIIAAASDYLDNAIPAGAPVRELVACLDSAGTKASAASCLDELGLGDSDPVWHETVAERWWQKYRPLAAVVDEWIERSTGMPETLRSAIDDYLDDGLADGVLVEQDIDACRASAAGKSAPVAELAACLRARGTGIEDSDPEWFLTIARRFHQSVIGPDVASDIERLIAEQNADRDKVGSIVATASDYLDNAIPADAPVRELVACLDRANAEAGVAACLDDLGLADSDPEWAATVAARWWEADPRAVPDIAALQAERHPGLVHALETLLPPGSTDLARIGSVIADASELLRGELPPDMDLASLVACLRMARGNATYISMCLGRQMGADPAFESLGAYWAARNGSSRLPDNQPLVFSPQATIPERMLQENLLSLVDQSNDSTQSLSGWITPTISDDSYLSRALFDELRMRGIDRDDRVTLLFEEDTRYGRALADLLDCDSFHWRNAAPTTEPPCFENVLRHGYIRGLDGAGPRPADSSPSVPQSPSLLNALGIADLETSGANTLEDPIGPHQFDYLRQLSRDIARTRPAAIGILGTDVFDKKLVLQALRDADTGAVMFTTDLESLFEDRDERRWARNLIVASSHGLMYEGQCPGSESGQTTVSLRRFRDNYQTSYFLATCAAALINDRDIDLDILRSDVGVYEVGLRGLVSLQEVELSRRPLDPPGTWRALLLVVPQALAWLLLLSPLIGVALWHQTSTQGTPKIARVCWITVASLAAILLWQSLEPRGDPVRVGAGLSAWPTIVLQVGAIVLAVAFLAQSRRSLARNGDEIARHFDLDQPTSLRLGAAASGRAANAETPAVDLWYSYRRWSTYAAGRSRVLLMWLGVSAIVLIAYGPLTAHPHLARGLDLGAFTIPLKVSWLTVVAIVAVLGYASFCVDQMLRCRNFVRDLAAADAALTRRRELDPVFGRHREIAGQVATLELIGERTEAIAPLIVWPLALLSLLVLSGSGIFEGWAWSGWLVGAYVLVCSLVVFVAIELQRQAEAARSILSARLRALRVRGPGSRWNKRERRSGEAPVSFDAQIDAALERINSFRRGAFVDWFRHPLLKAILLPSTAPAILLLFQSLFY